MSSLGLEGDSIIYTGERPKNNDGPKRKPKGTPPSRKRDSSNNDDDNFDIESFLDSKRRR